MNFLRSSTVFFHGLRTSLFTTRTTTNFAKATLFTGLVGLSYQRMQTFNRMSYCQAGLSDFNDYSGRLTTLNGNPAVKVLLSQLRDKKTDTATFRHYSDRLMRLLVEEALAQEAQVERRMSPTGESYEHSTVPADTNDFAAVTIMRGGDSMLTEVFNLLPGCPIGKVLIQRDEESADKRPVFYYAKLPENIAAKKRVFVLDPMCATGGTAAMCIQKLVDAGVAEERITFINLITVEQGVAKVMGAHPKVRMLTACVDPVLNGSGYICPGLGDFGDRYFGSKLPQ